MCTSKLLRFFIILTALLFYHSKADESKMEPENSVQIRIGDYGKRFANAYPNRVKINHESAGLSFFSIDWKAKNSGKVLVQYGKNGKLTIANVLYISAAEDVDFASEGLSQISVTAELSNTEFIGHEEARKHIQAVLDSIRNSGWETTIPRNEPRLRGKEMVRYALNNNEFTTLDSAYQPTIGEWMSLSNSAKWTFHSQDTFLEVGFTRDRAHLNPNKPGVYLLNYVIKNQQEHFRSDVQSKDRGGWMQVLPRELENLARERASKEASLRAQGVSIDETYLDPPFPKK